MLTLWKSEDDNQTGRNLAVIIEVATMNYRQRAMGNNSAKELMEQLGLTDDVQP